MKKKTNKKQQQQMMVSATKLLTGLYVYKWYTHGKNKELMTI
jgi:hypothetical protein